MLTHHVTTIEGRRDSFATPHVPTKRYSIERGQLRSAGQTSNAGIACYVCEYACKFFNSLEGNARSVKSLVEQITAEAVTFAGVRLWRWEARPSRADYAYPPDWDDTCKAIDAIQAYEQATSCPVDVTLPSREQLRELLEASLFESRYAGEDVRLACDSHLAMYMFMANKDKKQNNTEDIFVTSVVLRTLVATLDVDAREWSAVIEQLLVRLCEAAEKGLAGRVPFSLVSRCYLSWGLFLLTLSDVGERMPEHRERIDGLIDRYLQARVYVDLCGDTLRPLLARDELCYARLLSERVGGVGHEELGDHERRLTGECGVASLGLLYRHRRLGHVYGAAQWSNTLKRVVRQAREGASP